MDRPETVNVNKKNARMHEWGVAEGALARLVSDTDENGTSRTRTLMINFTD